MSQPSKRRIRVRFHMAVNIGAVGNMLWKVQSTRSAPPSCSIWSWTRATRRVLSIGRPCKGSGLAGRQPFLIRLARDPEPRLRTMQQTPPEDQHPAELAHRAQNGHALGFAARRAVLRLEFGVSMDLLSVGTIRRLTGVVEVEY